LIRRFADSETRALFERGRSRRFGTIAGVVVRKLEQLDAATRLDDLRIPPGNRLEELSGDRKGQHSIRVNDQYRLCFRWDGEDAYKVEVTHYH
jgi:toxin HigB-1